MAYVPFSLSFLANMAVGLALWALAGIVLAAYRRGPARKLLAAYLAVVGTNYVLGSLMTMEVWGGPGSKLDALAMLTTAVDPPLLLLFALAERGTWARPWLVTLLAAVAGGLVVSIGGDFLGAPWHVVRFAFLGACYLGALAVLLARHAREDDTPDQPRRDALLLVVGVITLARLPLGFVDTAVFRGFRGRVSPQSLVIDATLVILYAVVALVLLAARRRPPAVEARRFLFPLGALLGVVALVWLSRFVPAIQTATYPYFYSIRWFLLMAVLLQEPHRSALLGDDPRGSPRLRGVFLGALGVAAFAAASSLVAELAETSVPEAVLSGLVIVGAGLVIASAFRLALPSTASEVSSRRVSLYRAQVELGAPPERLAELRKELGLSAAQAREVEALVRLEQSILPSAAGPEPGKVFLGRYRIERVEGVGTFGRAWAAQDLASGKRVVLKEMREEWRDDPRALRRFVREIRSAMRIHHPNLVAFQGIERCVGGFVLVLDRVEGETLRARLARGPLSEAEAARLARDVASGLAALHEAGLVHRDVKPENVVLRPDGTAVLLDLGAAMDSAERGTISDIMGTPAYMSPEQTRGEVGPAADVYALGVLVWEALVGASPPEGAAPPAWKPFLDGALDPDPARRFPDAARALHAAPAPRPASSPSTRRTAS